MNVFDKVHIKGYLHFSGTIMVFITVELIFCCFREILNMQLGFLSPGLRGIESIV